MSEESKSRIIDQSKIQSILAGSVFSKIPGNVFLTF